MTRAFPVRAAAVSALLLSLLAAVPAATVGATLTPADRARLERGETVVRLMPIAGERYPEGFAARILPREPERVARAVGDVTHWTEWVPYLESVARGSEKEAARPAWHLRFDLPVPLRNRHYAARFVPQARGEGAEGAWEVSWASVPGSGNVAWARGSFSVSPYGAGGSLVVFRTATETGDGTPRFLLDRVLRKSLPWVLDGLAQQVNRCRYTVPRPRGCREEPATSP